MIQHGGAHGGAPREHRVMPYSNFHLKFDLPALGHDIVNLAPLHPPLHGSWHILHV